MAVKQLFSLIMDSMDVGELASEVSALAVLGNHPNVVRFFGCSKQDETVCLVMEWCETSLEQLVVSPAIWPSPAVICASVAAKAHVLRTLKQVASAMAFLHSNRLVHLDLKPGNVLVASCPNPFSCSEAQRSEKKSSLPDSQDSPMRFPPLCCKICDFGLSKKQKRKRVAGGEDVTNASAGLGTPLFMAPELFEVVNGNLVASSQPGGRSFEQLCKVDVYAFGVLCAMLCNRGMVYQVCSIFGSRLRNNKY